MAVRSFRLQEAIGAALAAYSGHSGTPEANRIADMTFELSRLIKDYPPRLVKAAARISPDDKAHLHVGFL